MSITNCTLNSLNSYGVKARIKPDGSMSLSGMKSFPKNIRTEIIAWVKDNREMILKELTRDVKNVFTQKGFKSENKATPPTAKTAKRPFDSKDSNRGSRFPENQNQSTGLKIEHMTTCLHGRPCRHLHESGGNIRPTCRVKKTPVFDLEACPREWWFKATEN